MNLFKLFGMKQGDKTPPQQEPEEHLLESSEPIPQEEEIPQEEPVQEELVQQEEIPAEEPIPQEEETPTEEPIPQEEPAPQEEQDALTGNQDNGIDWRNINVNIREVNELIADLRENVGPALIASGIISYETGSCIASYQMDDKSAALLGKYTTFMRDMIAKAEVNGNLSYMAVKLPGNLMSFDLVFKSYCWLSIINTAEVSLGMIMNGVLPDCIENFQAKLS